VWGCKTKNLPWGEYGYFLELHISGDHKFGNFPGGGACPRTPLEAERLWRSVLHSQLQFPFGTPLYKNPGYGAVLPLHLPGKPSSFQAHLTSVFPDPSNSVVERANIHASSAKASTYKDNRTSALLAATFPSIRVGNLAGEATNISFQGEVFPQFMHIAKGNYKCAICISYLRWAIQNNQPHSAARSKKATTDAILGGTAEFDFSGLVQVQEHSVSKCHLKACGFWKRDKRAYHKALAQEGILQEEKDHGPLRGEAIEAFKPLTTSKY